MSTSKLSSSQQETARKTMQVLLQALAQTTLALSQPPSTLTSRRYLACVASAFLSSSRCSPCLT